MAATLVTTTELTTGDWVKARVKVLRVIRFDEATIAANWGECGERERTRARAELLPKPLLAPAPTLAVMAVSAIQRTDSTTEPPRRSLGE